MRKKKTKTPECVIGLTRREARMAAWAIEYALSHSPPGAYTDSGYATMHDLIARMNMAADVGCEFLKKVRKR